MSWCGAKLSCRDGGRCACGLEVKAELGIEAPKKPAVAVVTPSWVLRRLLGRTEGAA